MGRPVFVTWRLRGSLPEGREFPSNLPSGKAFIAIDRFLDNASTGPFYLRQPEIAEEVVQALHYGADVLKLYELHAWVVMPNHVHILITPHVPLPKITKSIKGFTAKKANATLKLTGSSFWQEESYDHEALNEREFEKIKIYIEENPVRAGLVLKAEDFRWSSASGT